MEVKLSDCKIDTKPIGNGGYGTVFKGVHKTSNKIYAIKEIKIQKENEELIKREIEIMTFFKNPAIMNCHSHQYTDISNEKKVYIFMDWMEKSSLQYNIEKNLLASDNTIRQIILIGIAYGMSYLHNNFIIHRDLKPQNILLNNKCYPLISDFGLSKKIVNGQTQHSNFLGSVEYQAPEIILLEMNDSDKKYKYDFSIDVYSFGILMYQVVTNKKNPYDKHTIFQFSGKMQKSGGTYRPTLPENIKKPFKNLIEKCWSLYPSERPTFNTIYQKLTSFIKNDEIKSDDCCFDDVKIDEVRNYIDYLNIEVQKSLKQGAQNEVEKEQLKDDVERLSKEIESLTKKIENLTKTVPNININESKYSISKIMTVYQFNHLPFNIQYIVISEISNGSNANQKYFSNVKKLLDYLKSKNLSEDCRCIEILDTQNDTYLSKIESNKPVKLLSDPIHFLYGLQSSQIKELESNDFNNTVKLFNDFSIEIAYKSENFDEILNIISDMKEHLNDTNIDISVFIEKKEETGNKFQNNQNINSIILDTSVKRITGNPNGSFCECSNLRKISISSVELIDTKSFFNCKSLKEIVIPSSVNFIGSYAFSGCTSLEQITILSSLEQISEGCFQNCESIQFFQIPAEVKNIEANAFEGCKKMKHIFIPHKVKNIGSNAFKKCSSLESIVIPSSVDTIGDSLFEDCTSLKQVSIPQLPMSKYIFKNCSSLIQVLIYTTEKKKLSKQDNKISIGDESFKNCSSLISFIHPQNIIEIGSEAFSGCSSLNSFPISSSVASIGQGAFKGCKSCSFITLPKIIKSIESYAFAGCSLIEVIIPSSVLSIGSYAFNECHLLNKVSIGGQLKQIGNNAFMNCEKLLCIQIPESVTFIGNNAFCNCTNLSNILINANESLEIGDNCFNGCSSIIHFDNKSSTILPKNLFKNCKNLQKIEISPSISIISSHAFDGCENLVFIQYSKIKYFGSFAFCGCKKFTGMYFPKDDFDYGESVFEGCINLKKINLGNVLEIKKNTFKGCTNLDEIIFSPFINEIESGAFQDCKSIKKFDIPQNVTKICSHAFNGCSNLEEISLFSNIEKIEDYAFNCCTCLKKMTISDSPGLQKRIYNKITNFVGIKNDESLNIPSCVTSIGSFAFNECTSITDVIFSSSLQSIGSNAFSKCQNLKKLTAPWHCNVKAIGESAFFECINLKHAPILSSLNSIPNSSFENCALEQITIPDSVYYIGKKALYKCQIKKITIPSNTIKIDDFAFQESMLETIDIKSTKIEFGQNPFLDCKELRKIYIKTKCDMNAHTIIEALNFRSLIVRI